MTTRVAHFIDPSIALARWRSDDLPLLVRTLNASGASAFDWVAIGISFAAGLVLALVTYRLGSLLHGAVRKRR